MVVSSMNWEKLKQELLGGNFYRRVIDAGAGDAAGQRQGSAYKRRYIKSFPTASAARSTPANRPSIISISNSTRSGRSFAGIRGMNWRPPFFLHSPRDRRTLITGSWPQPAWQRTSTLLSSPSRIERLGSRSSWAGQRAIQPPPAFRPPRALAMVSAFRARLAISGLRGFASVVRRGRHLGPRPFGEDREKAGYVLRDLACVLGAQVTSEARLPDGARPVDHVIVCSARWFHRRPHGRLRAGPCLWPPASAFDR
jgi:hypothetical protein